MFMEMDFVKLVIGGNREKKMFIRRLDIRENSD